MQIVDGGMRGSQRLLRYLKQSPDVTAELARIESLLQGYSAYVRAQFTLFLQSVRDPQVLTSVAEAIADGRVQDAYAIVDSYVLRFGDAIVNQMAAVGQSEAEALATQEGVAGAGVGVSFNSASPAVTAAAERNRLEFIQNFTMDQRLTVNQALTQAAREGQSPEETARAIRDSIGLTSYQQQMVANYRNLLETNNKDALDRVLRDRRYDRGFENAIEAGEVLPEDRIDTMVDRYRERLLQLRGETIARTESGRVAENTRYLSTFQVADRIGTSYDFVVKRWAATRDRRTRDTHAAMDGQARLLEDYFDSPSGAQLIHPHDNNAPAEEVINCRCTVTYQFFTSQEEVDAFLREYGQGRYDKAA